MEVDWGDYVTNATIGGTRPIWTPNNIVRSLGYGTHNISVTIRNRCGYSESSHYTVFVNPLVTTSRVPFTTSIVEVAQSESFSDDESKKSNNATTIIAASVSVAAMVIVIAIIFIILFARKFKADIQEEDHHRTHVELPEIIDNLDQAITEFEEIQFGPVIGKGNFGIVYRYP